MSRYTVPFVAAIAVGCAGNASPGLLDPSSAALVWPAPPETARVAYLGQVASDRDMGKQSGFFANLRNGLLGTEENMLVTRRPFDTYVDGAGRIFVTSGAIGSILLFDPVEQTARILTPEGRGALTKPMGLTGDATGLVYVADPIQRRVVALKHTPEGEPEFAAAYGGRGALLNPVDVAVSPDGQRIYVADSYLHQVVVFDRGGSLLSRIGKDEGDLEAKDQRMTSLSTRQPAGGHGGRSSPDSEPSDLVPNRGAVEGEFRFPAFVDVGSDGTVYVSDGMNFRVQAFDPDGTFVRQVGRHGDVPGSFARPKGVATDSEGHLYVVDAAFNNVQVFDREGRLLLAFSEFGNSDGQVWMPSGIAIDAADRIYLTDRYNDRIQVFQYLHDPTVEASLGQSGEGQ
ncbi:MAG: hypothetical protein ACE5FP_05850 [Gemmatimonadota bacterium]